jgi:hypothetical protein
MAVFDNNDSSDPGFKTYFNTALAVAIIALSGYNNQLISSQNTKIDSQYNALNMKLDSKLEAQNTKLESQNTKLESQNTKLEAQNAMVSSIQFRLDAFGIGAAISLGVFAGSANIVKVLEYLEEKNLEYTKTKKDKKNPES